MMNKKAGLMAFPVILLALIMIITLLALISPLKSVLLNVINNQLVCSVDDENTRSACIALKGSLIFFVFTIGYFIIKAVTNAVQE